MPTTVSQLEKRLDDENALNDRRNAFIESRLQKLEADLSNAGKSVSDLDKSVLEKSKAIETRLAPIEAKLESREEQSSKSHVKLLNGTVDITVNKWLAVVIVSVVSGFCLVMYFWMTAPQDRVGTIAAAVFNYTGGKSAPDPAQEVSVIFSLNTPHEKTLETLEHMAIPPLTPEEKKFYKLDPGANEAFEKDLRAIGAQGFNRWEVWGSGSRPVKPMWQWNITWNKDHPVKVEDIVALYEKHFHRSKGIYIEETRVGRTIYSKP